MRAIILALALLFVAPVVAATEVCDGSYCINSNGTTYRKKYEPPRNNGAERVREIQRKAQREHEERMEKDRRNWERTRPRFGR